jgi:hypothetical protein
MVSKYEANVHFARCWEELLGKRGCWVPSLVGSALNFSDGQIKHSDYVG